MINILIIIFSLLIIFFINKFSSKISIKTKLIDKPDNIRKFHKKEVPLLGGLMIFSSFCAINLYLYLFQDFDKNTAIVFATTTCCFIVGLVDDYRGLAYKYKFFFLIIFFYFFISLDESFQLNKIYFSTFKNEIYLDNFSVLFTVLCLLLLANAINLLDGIDGLCISISIIWLIWLMIIFQNIQLLYIALIISLLYVLILNLKKDVFLGDSGSLFLGSLIGLNLILHYNLKISSIYLSVEDIFIILMLPGLDMLRVFLIRIFNKKNPFSPDRNHVHHLLIAQGFNAHKALIVILVLILFPILLNYFTKIDSINIILFYVFFYSLFIFCLKKLVLLNK